MHAQDAPARNPERRESGWTGMSGWLRAATLVACAGGVVPSLALALPMGDVDVQPYDLNSPGAGAARSGQDGAVPTARETGGEVLATPVVAGPESYRVTRLLLEYRADHPQHPSLEELLDARVRLGVRAQTFDTPGDGLPTTTIALRDISEGNPAVLTPGALGAIAQSIVRDLNDRGIGSVVVQVHPEDLDAQTGADLRGGGRGDLRLIVWTGIIGEIRSIAAGERLEKKIAAGAVERVNAGDKVHARIRAQSPVQPGELMGQKAIQDYLYRLNRHPGRRVDATVSPGDGEQQISLDYIVQESKPWTIYGQISNTGTEATSEIRERVGFQHNQLTRSDDVLRLDYVTGNFQYSHALLASYEFPIRSDVTRLRLFGSYSEFDASDVGLGGENFSGQNYTLGGEFIRNVYQHRQFFLDLVGGVRWSGVRVTNDFFGENGRSSFIIPSIGMRAERITDVSALTASVSLDVQTADLGDVDKQEIQRLGRNGVDDSWQVLRFDVGQSFHIEPLISDAFWGTGESGPTTLAREVFVGLRGQYAFNNRLIANEQDVLGGLYTVRGYPESIAAGDSTIVGTLEYRYHLPRAWPISQPGYKGDRKLNWFPRLGGENFRYAPSEAFGYTDWDLILKAFVDAGQTEISSARAGETSETLVGAGLGVEFQFKRNLIARLDWGFALSELDIASDPVDTGDNRLHFVITASY